MLAYIGLHICWTEVLSDKSCSYHVGTQTYQSDYPCAVYFVLAGIHFYDASSFCLLSHPVDLFSLYCFPRPHDSIPENRVFQNVPLCTASMCLCMYNLWKDKREIPWRTSEVFHWNALLFPASLNSTPTSYFQLNSLGMLFICLFTLGYYQTGLWRR